MEKMRADQLLYRGIERERERKRERERELCRSVIFLYLYTLEEIGNQNPSPSLNPFPHFFF
jgi:hypothetical protein